MKLALRSNHKKIIVTTIVILLMSVIAGIVVWLGMLQWKHMAAEASSSAGAITSLRSRVTSADSREQKMTLLAEFKEFGGNCEGQWWFSWQRSSISQSEKYYNTCTTLRDSIAAAAESARNLREYLEAEAKILTALNGLKIDNRKANWQVSASKAASATVKQLSSKGSVPAAEPVRKEALKRVKTIESSWKALESASKKEDKDAYQKSYEDLKAAYTGVKQVVSVSDKQITPLINAFLSKTIMGNGVEDA